MCEHGNEHNAEVEKSVDNKRPDDRKPPRIVNVVERVSLLRCRIDERLDVQGWKPWRQVTRWRFIGIRHLRKCCLAHCLRGRSIGMDIRHTSLSSLTGVGPVFRTWRFGNVMMQTQDKG